ncbi:MAG: response regulator receiver [Bacteroidetes bacterium]|jgi:CheY-like chemotaxis protein|nr:response regulator receiver [Bacteroidota bacterium]
MSQATSNESIDILLVEDNPGDGRLTREILVDQKICNRLHIVENGVDAMAFLRREGRFSDAPRPGLVLLDLNLPKKGGREVLLEIKKDPVLKSIPVVILTASQTEEDVLRSYGLHANYYITKPVNLEQLMGAMRAIDNLWLTIVTVSPQ